MPPADHRQRHLQLLRASRRGVRHAAIDTDLGGRVETQAQALPIAVQAMLQIGIQAFRVETAKQALGGEVAARLAQVGKLFTPPQGASGRGDAVDKAEALGRADDEAVGQGQHRRIEHHHPEVQLRPQQRRVVMQHPAERVADAPHRLAALLEVVQQLVDQVAPVVIHREARVVAVLRQMQHRVIRCQGGEQLAVGGRGKPIGMGEEHGLSHGGRLKRNDPGIVRQPRRHGNDETANE
ncbi:hypothetical protein D9M68_658080 [compost metagenome]